MLYLLPVSYLYNVHHRQDIARVPETDRLILSKSLIVLVSTLQTQPIVNNSKLQFNTHYTFIYEHTVYKERERERQTDRQTDDYDIFSPL